MQATIAQDQPEHALPTPRPPRARPLRVSPGPNSGFGDVFGSRRPGGRIRAVRRLLGVVLWTLPALLIQAVLVRLPGRGKEGFGRVYHAVLCRLIGLEVRVVGTPAAGRPVLFLSNHTSWLDVLVLGGVLEASFVAKGEVAQWPVIGTIARLGRTVFVSRSRGGTGREADAMRSRLAAGDSLILFPEGTSNDGSRTLPFRSAFLATAEAARQVQPVSLVYDRLGGLPAGRRDRPLFAWYGDMDIANHFWTLARRGGTRVTVLLHEPFEPGRLPDRKVLTREVGRIVAAGCAGLRQNRPTQPLPAPSAPQQTVA